MSGKDHQTTPVKVEAHVDHGDFQGFNTRVIKRETHSSRARLSVFVAIVVGLIAVLGLLESILRAMGEPAWLVDPLVLAEHLVALPQGFSQPLLGAIGVVILFFGLVLLINAIAPGRRARHKIPNSRAAVVVDNEVIASALARRARWQAGVTREQVMVMVASKLVQVNIRPTSGIMIDSAAVQQAVEAEIKEMQLSPLPRVVVNVSRTGVIGV